MTKPMTYLAFVLAVAPFAQAVGADVAESIATGTSVENQPLGALDVDRDDSGQSEGEGLELYWRSSASTNSAIVTAYGEGQAYDYAAKGMKRNAFLADAEPTTNKFLELNLEASLDRLIQPRESDGTVSNLVLSTGIYSDTLVKFSPSVAEPVVDAEDRVIVWMKETEQDDGSVTTNLMVTAGQYNGDYGSVQTAHYPVTNTVAAGTWCRLTIRTIPDVTEYSGGIARTAPAFVIYLDGAPVVIDRPDVADDTAVIGNPGVRGVLSAEARTLITARRLFPCLVGAASGKAKVLSRLTFGGIGALDDVSFSTESPDYARSDGVFTLEWDAGLISDDLLCIVSNATGVVTNHVDATSSTRYRDFSLGTNQYSHVTVTNLVFDETLGYSNGVWTAEGGCTVTNGNSFVCAGSNANPIGRVVSTRNVIGMGGSGFNTFTQAKAEAKKKGGTQTILLNKNITIRTSTADRGSFPVSAGDDLVLDLNGFTLQGTGADPTIRISGGKLRITDTSPGKTGRVLPSTGRKTDLAVVTATASVDQTPVLCIDAGRYEGAIVLTNNQYDATMLPVCSIEGGSYTNVYGDARFFYLESYVTNGVYFGLGSDDYWSTVATGYIWCGKGANNRWTTKNNWKGKVVPTQASDSVIFPPSASADGWQVDFGSGVAPKAFWLDENIVMSGTNEFGDVKIESGEGLEGRFAGDGMMTFTGKLPGLLTGETGAGEVRLGANWRGCVKVINVQKTQAIKTLMGWGTSYSSVELNGICGYLSDRASYALPYALVLTDFVTAGGATTNSAWRNDVGYTGSVISFPRLSGTGTFESPKNLREILQVFQFKNVEDFTGRFKLGGKRLLLGTGSIVAQSKAGHYTFSNAVRVNSGLDWTGVSAHFGTNILVNGNFGDRLMTYTGTTSEVAGVTVNLANGSTGRLDVVKLDVGHAIVIKPLDLLDFGGQKIPAESIVNQAKAGETFDVPAGSAVTIDGNRVIVNGTILCSFADYYKVTQMSGSTYSVMFDETEATPTLAEVSIVEGQVVLQVKNAKKDLLYGLQTATELGDDNWQGPTEWKRAEGDTVTFGADAIGSAAFFRVIMTDKVKP